MHTTAPNKPQDSYGPCNKAERKGEYVHGIPVSREHIQGAHCGDQGPGTGEVERSGGDEPAPKIQPWGYAMVIEGATVWTDDLILV